MHLKYINKTLCFVSNYLMYKKYYQTVCRSEYRRIDENIIIISIVLVISLKYNCSIPSTYAIISAKM